MYEQIIGTRDEGQRLDKYLHKLLPEAGTSFLYKMMRKKNITLNDKKAQGSEKLAQGDSIKIYFAGETLEKFMGTGQSAGTPREKQRTSMERVADRTVSGAASVPVEDINVIFESPHLLFANKPAGILSQKAKPQDYSINEWIVDYLKEHENLSEDQIRVFKPCICNRLDRNTSGLVLCAKSIKGAQFLSEALRKRTMEKYYLTLVKGRLDENTHLTGYLCKDERNNKVTVSTEPLKGSSPIETSYEVIRSAKEHSLLRVHLITGKSHQIRAHLASIGHPIIGDDKYGDKTINRSYRDRYGIKSQMLHAWQVCFPDGNAALGIEPNHIYTAEIPQKFDAFL